MNQQEFFEHVLKTFEQLRIPYMLTGAVAAMLHGESRLTNDLDVVVELPVKAPKQLVEAFPEEDFYSPPLEVINDEILRGGQFDIIHVDSGSKVDFVLRKVRETLARHQRDP